MTSPTIITNTSAIDFKSVTSGVYFSVGIDTGGNLYSWGYGAYGSLAQGNTTDRTSPVKIALSGNPKFKEAALTYYGIVALTETGELWIGGYNNTGNYGFHGDGSTSVRPSLTLSKMANFSGAETIVDIDADSYLYPSVLLLE